MAGPKLTADGRIPTSSEVAAQINRSWLAMRVLFLLGISGYIENLVLMLTPGRTFERSSIPGHVMFWIVLPIIVWFAMIIVQVVYRILFDRALSRSHPVFKGCESPLGLRFTPLILIAIVIPNVVFVSSLDLGSQSGRLNALVAAIFYLAVCVFFRRVYLKNIRRVGNGTEARSDWKSLIDEVSQKTNVVLKQAYVFPATIANAAVLENGDVFVCKSASRILNRDELAAVLCHEISHLKDRDVSKFKIGTALTFAIIFAPLGYALMLMYANKSSEGGSIIPQLVSCLCCAFMGMAIFSNIKGACTGLFSRKSEFKCDAFAAKHYPAKDLANALIKIHRINCVPLEWPRCFAWMYTHPCTAERIKRLGFDWRTLPANGEPIEALLMEA